jgi:hypothetical protein
MVASEKSIIRTWELGTWYDDETDILITTEYEFARGQEQSMTKFQQEGVGFSKTGFL